MADAEALFAEHQRGVIRYLTRLVGHADTARDLTQEVFLRVLRADVPRAGTEQLRGWVFRIARNLALNHLRDRGRRPDPAPLPETSAQPARQELSMAVREALARLADLDRDVFLLREAAGLSYDEIGCACELTTDAVRARLHRARIQLREELSRPLQRQGSEGIRLFHRGRHDERS